MTLRRGFAVHRLLKVTEAPVFTKEPKHTPDTNTLMPLRTLTFNKCVCKADISLFVIAPNIELRELKARRRPLVLMCINGY